MTYLSMHIVLKILAKNVVKSRYVQCHQFLTSLKQIEYSADYHVMTTYRFYRHVAPMVLYEWIPLTKNKHIKSTFVKQSTHWIKQLHVPQIPCLFTNKRKINNTYL